MKLIAIDLDGTLLGHDKKVCPENVTAINEALHSGVKVVIATGRHYQDAKRLIASTGLQLPIIGSNGASIHEIDGTCLQLDAVDREDLHLVFKDLADMKICFMALGANHVYTLSQSLDIMAKEVETFKTPLYEADMYRIKRELRAMVEEKDGLIYDDPHTMANVDDKILNILAVSYNGEKRLEGMAHFSALNRLHVFSSYRNNFEMTHADVSKGRSVKFYANRLGIKDYEICAIGDNYNDVSMIQIAGIGVAMGNAELGVKNLSDFVTLSNQEAGVAHAIRKVLFLD